MAPKPKLKIGIVIQLAAVCSKSSLIAYLGALIPISLVMVLLVTVGKFSV